VQMEMSQSTYMDETPPFRYDESRASRVQRVLRTMLEAARVWKPSEGAR
jgi:N-formylglutamate deformylase